jgi:hypothetical protein
MPSSFEEHDNRTRRCPMLGHDVQFSYCRQPAAKNPCRKVLDCWWEAFDIRAYVEANYDRASIEQLLSPPKPKAMSLLELIRQAQERAGDK